MTNFWSLTKVQIKSFISALFGKKNKKSFTSMLGLCVLFVVLMCAAFSSMYIEIARQLSMSNMTEYIFLQAGMVAVLSICLICTIEARSVFFKSNDFELLQSLPIKSSSIVLSKYLSVLLSGYLYAFITLFPAMIIYFVFAGFNAIYFILMIVCFLIFPLLPIFISTLLGIVSAWISTKPFSKIVDIFFCILLIFGYILFSSKYQDLIQFYINNGSNFTDALSYVVPSVGLFIKSVFGSDVISGIILGSLNIVAFAFTILIVSLLYRRLNIANGKSKSLKMSPISYSTKSTMSRLLKVEAGRYFSSSIYLFNTYMFAIVSPIVIIMFKLGGIVGQLPQDLLQVIILLVISVSVGSCYISSISISMEGKKFQNTKAMPISSNYIIFSKVIFHFIAVLPMALLSSILAISLFWQEMSVLGIIAIFVIPILAILNTSQFGVLINLICPKMNFENENQVVKQSLSAIIGMIGGMVLSALPTILFFIIRFDINLLFLINFAYFIVLNLIFLIILLKKSKYLINKIEI